jgi:hypothetical protein
MAAGGETITLGSFRALLSQLWVQCFASIAAGKGRRTCERRRSLTTFVCASRQA